MPEHKTMSGSGVVEISEDVIDPRPGRAQTDCIAQPIKGRRTIQPHKGAVQAIRIILDVVGNDGEAALLEVPANRPSPREDIENPGRIVVNKGGDTLLEEPEQREFAPNVIHTIMPR